VLAAAFLTKLGIPAQFALIKYDIETKALKLLV
jgi:hypothetical protein